MNELLDDSWGEKEVTEYVTAGIKERFIAFLIDISIWILLYIVLAFCALGFLFFGIAEGAYLFFVGGIALMIWTISNTHKLALGKGL